MKDLQLQDHICYGFRDPNPSIIRYLDPLGELSFLAEPQHEQDVKSEHLRICVGEHSSVLISGFCSNEANTCYSCQCTYSYSNTGARGDWRTAQ